VRSGGIAVLLLCGCTAAAPDVCKDVSGSCIALELRGSSDLFFDAVHIVAGGFTVTGDSRPGLVHLPAILAVEPPVNFAGAFGLVVELSEGGMIVGGGRTSGVVATAGQHILISVDIIAGSAPDDLSVAADFAACGEPGQPCCANATCLNGACCDPTGCIAPNMPCAGGVMCMNGSCGCGTTLDHCCATGQQCVGGGQCAPCAPGAICVPPGTGTSMCCGAAGQSCCKSGSGVPFCANGVTCQSGMCVGGGNDLGTDLGSGCPAGECFDPAHVSCLQGNAPNQCGSNTQCIACSPTQVCKDGVCIPASCANGNGMPCCPGGYCASGYTCNATGMCTPCGQPGEPCCPGGFCAYGMACCVGGSCISETATCANTQGAVCGSNAICSGGTLSCGASGLACCAGGVCSGNLLACVAGKCITCGGPGEICCGTGSAAHCTTGCCDPQLWLCAPAGGQCSDGTSCQATGNCGGGNPCAGCSGCCPSGGGGCNSSETQANCGTGGVTCQGCPASQICQFGQCVGQCAGGTQGQPCCPGSQCLAGFVCNGTAGCTACGTSGKRCCPGGGCMSGCCVSGTCVDPAINCTGTQSCNNNVCGPGCGQSGAACCGGATPCGAGMICSGGKCTECGGVGQQCCVAGGGCSGTNCCDQMTGLCVAAGLMCTSSKTCTGGLCN
jgi:hypothetical protein